MVGHLTRAVTRAAQRPGFLAHELAGANVTELTVQLGCAERDVRRLLLCGLPRPECWEGDIAELAGYAHADAGALSVLLLSRVGPFKPS